MGQRSKLMWLLPVTAFLVVIAFGVGVIATAAYDSNNPFGEQAQGGTTSDQQLIEIELGDLYIKPAKLTADEGSLSIRVHNGGKTDHNFSIAGVGATEMIAPGQSEVLEIDSIEEGEYEFICAVPGHADGGMKGTLEVGKAASLAHESGMSAEEMMAHDAKVTSSFPAKTKGVGGALLEPAIEGGVKVFELTADEIKWETDPGNSVEAYAYNGMVPGPRIEAELGDRVRIVLHNKLAEPTTIHFHGMTVPADMDGVPVISQDAVLPGKSFTYEFTVKNTGSHMYHSHFNAAKQVPMGLLGALIVPDSNDPASDVDLPMVLNDGPLGFTLNGKGFPATAPIVAQKGQTIRIRYMNEGLLIHPMHLHGMPQLVISKDGHLLKHPYMADTVLVAPGERYDVLVKATEPGAWAFHCHVLNHVEGPDGMFGMVSAMIVE